MLLLYHFTILSMTANTASTLLILFFICGRVACHSVRHVSSLSISIGFRHVSLGLSLRHESWASACWPYFGLSFVGLSFSASDTSASASWAPASASIMWASALASALLQLQPLLHYSSCPVIMLPSYPVAQLFCCPVTPFSSSPNRPLSCSSATLPLRPLPLPGCHIAHRLSLRCLLFTASSP